MSHNLFKNASSLFAAALLVGIITPGCGIFRKKDHSGGSKEQRFIGTDIELKIENVDQMKEKKRRVAEKLLSDSTLDETAALELVMEQHAADYQGEHKDLSYDEILEKLKSHISTLAKNIHVSDTEALKPTYEAIHKELLGDDAQYSADAVSVASLVYDNLMQCFSGTISFELIRRSTPFRFFHNVVIFSSGHVLPGFMAKKDNKWHLVGIETTALGDAIVEYGATDAIKEKLVIVDADYFLIMELFENDFSDTEATVLTMVGKTAEKYDLPFDAKTFANDKGEFTSSSGKKLNHSPFAFGKAEFIQGPVKRKSFEKKRSTEATGMSLTTSEVISDVPKLEVPKPTTARACAEGSTWIETPQGCLNPKSGVTFLISDVNAYELGGDIEDDQAIVDFCKSRGFPMKIGQNSWRNGVASNVDYFELLTNNSAENFYKNINTKDARHVYISYHAGNSIYSYFLDDNNKPHSSLELNGYADSALTAASGFFGLCWGKL